MAIKFKKLIQGLLFVSSLGFAANTCALTSFDSHFSNAGKGGWNGLGIYYDNGHQASEDFYTGLTSVDALELTLNLGVNGNSLKDDDGSGPNNGTLIIASRQPPRIMKHSKARSARQPK
jgi:hypothetical protein